MKKNTQTKHPAAATWHLRATILALTGGAILTMTAHAQTWDNSWANPYVAAGYGDQCTAFSWGRFKVANGEALRFQNPQGQSVYPNAGLMASYVVQSPTVYRDTVPVRGALISWTKAGAPGHAANIERLYADGSADISEQNWPTGSGPSTKTLTASKLKSRSSTASNGQVTYYSLSAYVNPNRPSSFGTIYTTKSYTTLQTDFALLDEDGRSVNLVVGILANGQVVPGMAGSGTVSPNRAITVRFSNTSQLVPGRTYTFQVWAYDFRGLRSTKAKSFTW